MAAEQEKRKLTDLRVVDLRSELEKRGIDKMGVKAVLIERLVKAIEEEGHDPEVYNFEPPGKNTPKRMSTTTKSRSDPDTESESQSNADDTHDLSLDVDEEMRDDLVIKTENKIQKSDSALDSSPVKNEVSNTNSELDIASVEISIKEEKTTENNTVNLNEAEKPEEIAISVKQEKSVEEAVNAEEVKKDVPVPIKTKKIDPVKPEVKPKILVKKPAEVEKPVPDTNGVDNEDSINLDIGEDEEKLLADEEDSCSQEKDKVLEGTIIASSNINFRDDEGPNADTINSGGVGNSSLIVHVDEGDRAGKSQESGGEAKKEGTKDEERKQNSGDDKSKTQEELKDDKTKSTSSEQKSKDDKDKSKKSSSSSSSSSRNLWVSGLSSATRATDLKQVFSKYGKVIGAKVVTNARTPGARCYGYVTMATSEEASKCIQYLHRTELHGRMISVERAKGDSGPPRKSDSKTSTLDKKRHDRKSNGKPEEKKKDSEEVKKDAVKSDTATKSDKSDDKVKAEESVKSDTKEGETSGDKTKEEPEKVTDAEKLNEKKARDASRERKEKRRIVLTKSRSPYRGREKSPGRKRPIAPLLTFVQIREERERNRLRERERELREEERRGRDMIARQKEIERRQRDEAMRLEREKEKLRLERERIECERSELLRLERDRQRLERERLEREREELKRQQLRSAMKSHAPQRMHHLPSLGQPPPRFEEARRTVKRPADERREYPDDRKRVATERRFEAPPPRFEENRSNDFQAKKDARRSAPDFVPRRTEPAKFERNAFASVESRTSRRESAQEIAPRSREHVVPPLVVRGKDNRFERGAAPSFRVPREERRPESDHRSKVDQRQPSRDRYQDSSKSNFGSSSKGSESRYAGSTWHSGNSGPTPVKPFGSSTISSTVMAPRDSWASSADRKSDTPAWSRVLDSGWTGSSGSLLSRSGPTLGSTALYSSSSQNMPPSMSGLGMSSGPYSSDRFDSYKQSMGQIRKY